MNGSEVDILWVVIASALVFLMQPGFMCLESGLTRSKNSINVAVKNLADFVFSVLCFWGVGYGIMFSLSKSGLVGTSFFFVEVESSAGIAAFFLFQAMFCGTATTIFSGAVAERMKFSAYLIIVLFMSSIIYPIFGHWAWNGLSAGDLHGWLGASGFVDFAGSTVVHSVGGWVALAVLIVIGPRKGRFGDKQCGFGFNGSNLPLSVLGTCLLWFGWIGFNGGSTLVMNESVPRIIVYTVLAGSAGALSNLVIGLAVTKLPRVTFLINGSLGGLVAITANCHVVGGVDAVLIGLIAGAICFISEYVLVYFKIDDAVGAIPVHLCCGIWGTLAVAFFGDPTLLGTGLSMVEQTIVQLKGIVAAFFVAFLIPYYLIKKIDKIYPLRVSAEAEHVGLNVSEHGATTELVELFQAMDEQAASSDLSVRMPVEPFTEVGLIAERYNQVMASLENALSQTEAVVCTAKDGIVTCLKDSLEIISINPSGVDMFGFRKDVQLAGVTLPELFDAEGFQGQKNAMFEGKPIELNGKKTCGTRFPLEGVITEAGSNGHSFYIGTFRDITDQKAKENLMRESELRYRELFENTGTATIIINADGTIGMANQGFEQISGYSETELKKTFFITLLTEDEKKKVLEYRRLRLLGDRDVSKSYETKLWCKDGTVKPIFLNVALIPDTKKTIVTCIDLTELKETQNLLTKQRAYFLQLFEASSQAIVALDHERRITSVNKGFEQLFGYKEEEVKGSLNKNIVVPADLTEEMKSISNTVLSGNMVKKETYRLHKDGRRIPVSVLGFPIQVDETLEGIFYIYEDISERKAFEQQLYQQAFFDGLTQIANRILFMERLERALERSKRRKDFCFAVLLIDLDRFKWINDSLGHIAGDELLQTIAKRFKSCIRSGDTVARLGGDEFAFLLEEFDKNSQVIEIVNRVQQEAQQSIAIGNGEVNVSASIGVVLNTENYKNTEEILRDADIAMYRAKELGKARFQLFNKRLHKITSDALALENDLRMAIEEGELVLYYQPLVSASDVKLIGFEALVRWPREEKGIVSPDDFIPIAEETGLIIPLGEWVLQTACNQLKEWQNSIADATNLKINVNLSAKQFVRNDLVASVKKVIHQTQLDAKCLTLEITESAIMEGADSAVGNLQRLKDIGVKLAIDDFGTGYSSLAALQKFPIDDLKIDRSFIFDIEKRNDNKEIVKTIITLAKNLGLKVVAEGVENLDQLSVLEEMACDNVQGYYFSRPLEVEDVPAIIEKYR